MATDRPRSFRRTRSGSDFDLVERVARLSGCAALFLLRRKAKQRDPRVRGNDVRTGGFRDAEGPLPQPSPPATAGHGRGRVSPQPVAMRGGHRDLIIPSTARLAPQGEAIHGGWRPVDRRGSGLPRPRCGLAMTMTRGSGIAERPLHQPSPSGFGWSPSPVRGGLAFAGRSRLRLLRLGDLFFFEQGLELAGLEHLHHDVRSADEFALHVELGDGRPVGI